MFAAMNDEFAALENDRDGWKETAHKWRDSAYAGGVEESEQKFIKWLVEVLHYPYDLTFDPPAPVDTRALAAHWNRWDDWGLTDDEAYVAVCEELGVKP